MPDWWKVGEAAAGAAGGLVAWLRSHRQARVTVAELEKMQRRYRRELDVCRRRNRQLRDRLSALETEMTAIAKLLPGGDWFRRMGLDEHPDPARRDRDR